MPQFKERIKELLGFATLDLATFESLANDLSLLYEQNVIRFIFVGPRTAIGLPEPDQKILLKKYNLDPQKLGKYIRAILMSIHVVLGDEKEDFFETIKKAKDVKTANMFMDKAKLAEKLIEKYPTIRQGYLTYTFGTKYLEDLEWSADLKVFHSASERAKEKHPVFPSATLRFDLSSGTERDTDSFEFQVSQKDIDYMIKSLQGLRESMTNLTKKKIAGETSNERRN